MGENEMKKLLVLLMALMMSFTLSACGDNDDEPANSDNPSVSHNNSDGENNGGETFAWPSAASDIAWTGSGNIICVEKLIGSSSGQVEVYVDKATLTEVGEYIEKVKAFGISCSDDSEPVLEFDADGIYSWNGLGNSFQITLWNEEGPGRGYVDGDYQLKIVVPTEAGIFK